MCTALSPPGHPLLDLAIVVDDHARATAASLADLLPGLPVVVILTKHCHFLPQGYQANAHLLAFGVSSLELLDEVRVWWQRGRSGCCRRWSHEPITDNFVELSIKKVENCRRIQTFHPSSRENYPMDTTRLIAELNARIKQLETARALLAENDASNHRGFHKPTQPTGKRTMSAAGRAAVSAAQKKRWAKLQKG